MYHLQRDVDLLIGQDIGVERCSLEHPSLPERIPCHKSLTCR